MKRVIVESPLRGDRERNLTYLGAALADCLTRGEAPFASHWMYPGILDDDVPEQRRLGMEAGFAWLGVAEASVVYVDLGITEGMRQGIERAKRQGLPVEERSLPGWRERRRRLAPGEDAPWQDSELVPGFHCGGARVLHCQRPCPGCADCSEGKA